ncbi:hypothetical protein [Tessaracoccus caeni]|uniref:hypothetical protein n=1 Tax=Tessaracoccus caeni TaxID=3031239 RepID=UPI0023DA2359|nr:hypothetical protein [Tessaracoccus caeni]MDF1490383.1 hypothetical protein [Tessaracoccus caeni]
MADQIRIPSADDPAEAFAAVVALRRLANSLERSAVDSALTKGWTWAHIGEALGMTAQAAHKRLAPSKRSTSTKEKP